MSDLMLVAKEELIEHFERMDRQNTKVRELLFLDGENSFPCYAPHFSENEAERSVAAARRPLVDAVCRLTYEGDERPPVMPGILCGSTETLEAVERLNALKAAFKAAVQRARANFPPGDQIEKLVRTGYNIGGADHQNTRLLDDMLDLKRCYANFRVLPMSTDRFSWTWAPYHPNMKRISRAQTLKLLEEIDDEATRIACLKAMGEISDAFFVQKRRDSQPQLRANYRYWENGAPARSSATISGAVFIPRHELPERIRWVKETTPHFAPRPQKIESMPYFMKLGIFRYLPQDRL